MWTFKTLPKIGRKLDRESLPNLKALIDDMLSNPKYRNALQEAREESWAQPGMAAGRIADYMIAKGRALHETQG